MSNADGAPKTASLSEKSTYQDSELYTQTAVDVNLASNLITRVYKYKSTINERGIRVKTRTAMIAKCPHETVDTSETQIARSTRIYKR